MQSKRPVHFKPKLLVIALGTAISFGAQAAPVSTGGTFAMSSNLGFDTASTTPPNPGNVNTDNTITGFVDQAAGTWGAASTTTFFGFNWTASNGKLITTPGSYSLNTATGVVGAGTGVVGNDGTINFNVGAGQVAGTINFAWNTTTGIDVVEVWTVNSNGSLTPVAAPGMENGPFPGYNAAFFLTGAGLYTISSIALVPNTPGPITISNSGPTYTAPNGSGVSGNLTNNGSLTLGSNATVTVSGNYAQGSTGVLNTNIAPSGSHSTLVVNGATITLGGTLNIAAAAGQYLKTTYPLIQGSPGTALTGQFSTVGLSGLSNYGWSIAYGANDVLFTVFPQAPFVSAAVTPNQRAVGSVLDNVFLTSTGALYNQLNNIYTSSDPAKALDAVNGELHNDAATGALVGVSHAWDQVFVHMDLSASVDPPPHTGAWISDTYGNLRIDGNNNADGIRQTSNDVLLGGQTFYGDWILGVVGGYTNLDATRYNVGDTSSAGLWNVGAYAGHPWGKAHFGVLVGYSQGSTSFTGGSARTRIYSAQARLARTYDFGTSSAVTPMLIVEGSHLNMNSVVSSDPVLGLNVPSQSSNSADVRALARFDHAWTISKTEWVGSVGLGLRRLLTQPSQNLTMSFNGIPGASFTVQGVPQDRTVGLLTAGLTTHLSANLRAEIAYEGDYGQHTRGNALTGKLAWAF